jgi:hypothetical protein
MHRVLGFSLMDDEQCGDEQCSCGHECPAPAAWLWQLPSQCALFPACSISVGAALSHAFRRVGKQGASATTLRQDASPRIHLSLGERDAGAAGGHIEQAFAFPISSAGT